MTRGAGGILSLTRGPGALTHSPPPQTRLSSLLEGHMDDLVLEMGGSGFLATSIMPAAESVSHHSSEKCLK